MLVRVKAISKDLQGAVNYSCFGKGKPGSEVRGRLLVIVYPPGFSDFFKSNV